MTRAALEFRALPDVPEVVPGADLAVLTVTALERAGLSLQPGDVLVFAQKIVSKAEGRFRRLAETVPSRAGAGTRRALRQGRPARRTRAAGVERSGARRAERVDHAAPARLRDGQRRHRPLQHRRRGRRRTVLLLPEDPDASARRLRAALEARCGVAPGVIVSDSFGRPWRLGTVNVALGVAGIAGVDRPARRARSRRPHAADDASGALRTRSRPAQDSRWARRPRARRSSTCAGSMRPHRAMMGNRCSAPTDEDLFR